MGRMGHIAVGIDFAGDRLLAVEARGAGRLRAVEGAIAVGVPVAAALPAYAGFVRRLTAPLSSLDKARRVLPSMLDIELPFPLESCSYVFLDVRRAADRGVEALAVAARTEDLSAWIARCAAAGVDPVSVEHEAVALWRAWIAQQPIAREQTRLIAYLGPDRTSLAFGGADGLVAATGIRQGGASLAEPEAPALQRLALWWRAVRNADDTRAAHIAWCGPASDHIETRRALLNALFPRSTPREIVAPDTARFLAGALARSLAGRSDDTGNLRQGPLAHPQVARRASRERVSACAAAALAALLLGGVAMTGLYLLDRARESWQARLIEEARRVSGIDRMPRGQELFTAQRALQNQAAGWAAFARHREPGADALLARAVQASAGLGIQLQSAVVRPRSILLQGTAPDWDGGERLAAALSALGLRTELDRRDAGADERVHFTLRGEP